MGTALFGGAFDPFHKGHLSILNALDKHPLIQNSVVIPTSIPPHKPMPFFSAPHRLAMLKQVIHLQNLSIPVTLSDLEIAHQGPSYTIDTLRQLLLQNVYPQPFFIVIGADNFFTFHQWKYPEEILTLAHLLVLNREGYGHTPDAYRTYFYTHFSKGWEKVSFANMEPVTVSSQHIRDRLSQNLSISGLVPECIERYIGALW